MADREVEIIRGDDYSHDIEFTLKSTGLPINISGRTYTSQLRKMKQQTNPDATFVCVVTDGPNGELTLTLSHTVTATLPVGCYYWDVEENAGGVITTYIPAGKVKVISDVTR